MSQFGFVPIAFAAVAASACVSPSASPSATASGATAPQAAATLFAPGVISDARWQWRITFTPDGRTAYYTVSDAFFPQTRRGTIMESRMQSNGAWGTPTTAPFSGRYGDIDPYITRDGARMYFSSIRPEGATARNDLDIFVMQRTAAGWSEPERLDGNVNSSSDELYASLSGDGTIYFASGPFGPEAATDWNIYSAARAGSGFGARRALDAINTDLPFDTTNPTADWEFNPEISVDGETLIFTSLRPGGHGAGDLYVSRRRGDVWSAPRNLGPPINTANDEFHPTLSRDGRTLFFARTILRPALVPSDFYSIPASALGLR